MYKKTKNGFPIEWKSPIFFAIIFHEYGDTYYIKGQLISEWLFDVLNLPKKQRKNLMNFYPRI